MLPARKNSIHPLRIVSIRLTGKPDKKHLHECHELIHNGDRSTLTLLVKVAQIQGIRPFSTKMYPIHYPCTINALNVSPFILKPIREGQTDFVIFLTRAAKQNQ